MRAPLSANESQALWWWWVGGECAGVVVGRGGRCGVVWCGVGGEVRKVSKENRDSIALRARVRALVLLIPYCQASARNI